MCEIACHRLLLVLTVCTLYACLALVLVLVVGAQIDELGRGVVAGSANSRLVGGRWRWVGR